MFKWFHKKIHFGRTEKKIYDKNKFLTKKILKKMTEIKTILLMAFFDQKNMSK